MSTKPTGKRVEREARLRWVPLVRVRINPLAQRELNAARVDRLAAEMELEQLAPPTVNARDDLFFCLDGQHRIEGFKKWCGEGQWEDQQMQCWTYDSLSEEEEAEVFLRLNDTLTVTAYEKFRVGVHAGRAEETDIDRIVRAQGLRVSRERGDGAVRAVGTLRKVYRMSPETLGRSLRIIRDAHGEAGLEAAVIEGIGLLCQRFNGSLDEDAVVQRLGNLHGGVNGLLGRAQQLRQQTGNTVAQCVAAAAVEIHNRGRGGKKLPAWWKDRDVNLGGAS